MRKVLISSLMLLNITTVVHANSSALAVSISDNDQKNYIPITINNQSNLEVTTNSALVPEEAKVIPSFGSAMFNVEINETGSQKIRYYNGHSGCDFYIDYKNSTPYLPGQTFITGVPIDNVSMCNVQAMGGFNHLSVSIVRI